MNDTHRLASRGEITFDESIDTKTRAAILDMWETRLTGFCDGDIERYLRDNTRETTYSVGRLRLSGRTFYRLSWLLFVLRRLLKWTGLTISADVHNAHVSPCDEGYVTRGVLCVAVCGKIVRRKNIDMTAIRNGDRRRWGTVVASALEPAAGENQPQ